MGNDYCFEDGELTIPFTGWEPFHIFELQDNRVEPGTNK